MDDNAVRPPAQKRFFRIHQHRAVHQRHHIRIGRGVAIGGGTLHVQHEAVFLQILLDSADLLFTLAVFADLPRVAPIAADLAGFEVPDEFVVGYGLDYAQKYRNMPYIGVLKPEVYSEN